MASIQKAQEKLRQNNQNTDIFRDLRNSCKNKKEHLKNVGRKLSSKSQPEDLDEHDRTPHLIKSKTSIGKNQGQKHIFEEEILSQQNSQAQSSQQERRDRTPSTTVKITRKRGRKPKIISQKDKIYEEDQSNSVKSQRNRNQKQGKSLMDENGNSNLIKQNKLQGEQSNGDEVIQQDGDEDFEIKRRQSLQAKPQLPRRRGRPKKIQSVADNQSEHTRKYFHKRKMIKKISQSAHSSPVKKTSNKLSEEEIISGVKALLHKREELIQYLHSIKITPQNAKQILDLQVANILQAGPIDYKVRSILNLLKSSLLLKYFPDDSKNMRNYQKFARNKSQGLESMKQEKSREASQPECPTPMDIRKKTIIKLEKFLKNHPEVQSKAKELAIKIESYFEMADNEVGNRYKTIAYKVLSNLKDKTQSCNEIIKKLDENAYD